MSETTLLSLSNATFTAQDRTIVENINLRLQRNEITTIIGPNGAGKSTFIKMISGVYEPDGGEIFLENNQVALSRRFSEFLE